MWVTNVCTDGVGGDIPGCWVVFEVMPSYFLISRAKSWWCSHSTAVGFRIRIVIIRISNIFPNQNSMQIGEEIGRCFFTPPAPDHFCGIVRLLIVEVHSLQKILIWEPPHYFNSKYLTATMENTICAVGKGAKRDSDGVGEWARHGVRRGGCESWGWNMRLGGGVARQRQNQWQPERTPGSQPESSTIPLPPKHCLTHSCFGSMLFVASCVEFSSLTGSFSSIGTIWLIGSWLRVKCGWSKLWSITLGPVFPAGILSRC